MLLGSKTSRLALAVILLAGLPACAEPEDPEPDPDPPELAHSYETEHFEIHSDIPRCAGDFARWEGFLAFAEAELGVALPERFAVYVWAFKIDGEAWCDNEAADGCTLRAQRRVYAQTSSVEHELVHAITADLPIHDAFFHEGLAEALASATRFGLYAPSFPAASAREVDYGSAGHFVRWLIEDRGAQLPVDYLSGEVDGVARFEALYGAPLDDAVAAFYAEAEPVYLQPYEHSAPELDQLGEAHWASSLSFDCAKDDVRGHFEGLEVLRQLTIDEPGYYGLWASGGETVRFRRKDPDASTSMFTKAFLTEEIAWGWFEAGSYELGVAGTDAEVDFEMWRYDTDVPTQPEGAP